MSGGGRGVPRLRGRLPEILSAAEFAAEECSDCAHACGCCSTIIVTTAKL